MKIVFNILIKKCKNKKCNLLIFKKFKDYILVCYLVIIVVIKLYFYNLKENMISIVIYQKCFCYELHYFLVKIQPNSFDVSIYVTFLKPYLEINHSKAFVSSSWMDTFLDSEYLQPVMK